MNRPNQQRGTIIKSLAKPVNPKKLTPKAAYALAVKLMAEMDDEEKF